MKMTYDDALDILRSMQAYTSQIEESLAIDMAIKAIKKQLPKAPIEKHYEDDGEQPYIKYSCPNGCCIQLDPLVINKRRVYQHNYCNLCGQKVDWGEET